RGNVHRRRPTGSAGSGDVSAVVDGHGDGGNADVVGGCAGNRHRAGDHGVGGGGGDRNRGWSAVHRRPAASGRFERRCLHHPCSTVLRFGGGIGARGGDGAVLDHVVVTLGARGEARAYGRNRAVGRASGIENVDRVCGGDRRRGHRTGGAA